MKLKDDKFFKTKGYRELLGYQALRLGRDERGLALILILKYIYNRFLNQYNFLLSYYWKDHEAWFLLSSFIEA